MAEQCKGIAHAITQIHDYRFSNGSFEPQRSSNSTLVGRHGDIKPENILWFPRSGSPLETDLSSERGTPKLSDFGCLYLEFITWLMGGKELLDFFREARTTLDHSMRYG